MMTADLMTKGAYFPSFPSFAEGEDYLPIQQYSQKEVDYFVCLMNIWLKFMIVYGFECTTDYTDFH